MSLIAHLSDLHLLESDFRRRRGLSRYRLAYLNAGRPCDPEVRQERAKEALRQARRANAEHVLLTGDLTEDGVPAQFDLLREVLKGSGFVPEQITLVPGNHDVYADPKAWEHALQGPLRAYRRTSGARGVAVLDGAVIKPFSTVIEKQTFHISCGAIKRTDVETTHKLKSDPICRARTTILAMHHPPLPYKNPMINAVDGTNCSPAMRDLLTSHGDVRVAHGHIHRKVEQRLHDRQHAQVFSARATRDGKDSLALYHAEAGGLVAAPLPTADDAAALPAVELASTSCGAMLPAQ